MPTARSGIRVLNHADAMFYRLAVQQGETEFGYLSTHPIFFEWVNDPLQVMENWRTDGLAYYFVQVFAFFVFMVLSVIIFTAFYSCIGRTPKR